MRLLPIFFELKSTITANNYEIEELSLSNPVPEDAATIFFVSPKTDLLAKELENLLAFMEKGGDAIFHGCSKHGRRDAEFRYGF